MSHRLNATWRLFFAALGIAVATGILFPHVMPSTALAAKTEAPAHGEAKAAINGGDSRMNAYRLERDSCCVGED